MRIHLEKKRIRRMFATRLKAAIASWNVDRAPTIVGIFCVSMQIWKPHTKPKDFVNSGVASMDVTREGTI